ncbi:hypothetical protein DPMN_056920 [Dreissena polymorpha]|uniref:Uncharacterized protein n=1 Tax=Dreissena polymorpha TaxID=45954 RepID=A0A9D4CUD4_DREPO|nr:hypothetical protein DPMN_056920 [Dreissena polymorpha]
MVALKTTHTHVFQRTRTIFEISCDIIRTKPLEINVNSTLLTRKTAPPPSGNDFNRLEHILTRPRYHNKNFIGTNFPTHKDWQINHPCFSTKQKHFYVLIKFHKDWIINVTSRVLARKNATPPCSHFNEHWTTNVTFRVLTRKTAPPPGSHVFQQTRTIFKLIQDIFHEDWTINVTSRVLTRFYYTLKPYKVNCHAPWRPYIIGTHVLTKFHEDWTKNVTSRETATPPGSHVFQPTRTIFELVQDIIITNVLTKFHEDWTINVTSRVLTRKTAPPSGGHVFHPTGTIFELVQDFIGTHVPTKVLTRKTATPPGSHVFQPTGTIFDSSNILLRHMF